VIFFEESGGAQAPTANLLTNRKEFKRNKGYSNRKIKKQKTLEAGSSIS